MKKIFYLIFIAVSFLAFVTSCEIDNYPEPDAQVYGAIRDSVGGGLIETEIGTSNASRIGVWELGKFAANPVRREWLIKNNGEYRNNLVYSNEYKIDFTSCNFFPYTLPSVIIKPGENKLDFNVYPFIRIKNLTITYDEAGKKINASFTLEGGKPNVKVSRVELCSWSDMYVGFYTKKTLTAGTGTASRSYTGAAQTINPATVINLSIDLAANAGTSVNGFGVHRNYYFRVGALATGLPSTVGTPRYNYAPYVVIPINL